MMNIPFSPPYINDEVIKEVTDTLQSGWITTGPKTKLLEKKIEEYIGAKRVICLNSATSALMLALKWYGVKEGDEVIVPAYTYCVTALVVMHLGAKPIMVDVNDDFNINPDELNKAITDRTKVVIPVDIGGCPVDVLKIKGIVESKKHVFNPQSAEQANLGRILVLQDAAHAFGAIYNNSKVGSSADIAAFSFHAVKNLTSAEGGALCFNLDNSDELYGYFSLLSLNGQTKDAYSKSQANSWKYDIVIPGFKVNMPDICASIALAQLRSYDVQLDKRKQIFDYYTELLSPLAWTTTPKRVTSNGESSCHLYMLRIKGISEEQRDLLISLLSDMGISTNVHFIPLPMLTVFKDEYNIASFPNSYSCYHNEISLPIYPQLTKEEVKYICNAIINCYSDVVINEAV